jgi:hypothetical protein
MQAPHGESHEAAPESEGAEMSRTQNKVIGALAAVLAAAALLPTAGLARPSASAPEIPGGGLSDRSVTELGQAVGEPGDEGSAAATARYSRTPTELAQRVAPSVTPDVASSGFDWGDAAIGAGAVLALGLTGFGGLVLMDRRRHTTGSARVPAISS